ncbi:CN hydrolase domain containing protein [Asbolus verrucosus]|uniref:omega-amidase n=1 Tax=Asbolus verrucosus TaxID=1661398 RepID=A0A482V9U9_ASBVE|nr:CN hydrolase domain containing protein [Asbolus verrucosus]
MSQNGFRAALIQSLVGTDRAKNLKNASSLIDKAKANGAQVVALPECFNSPYGTKFFAEYAETIPDGPTSKMLSEAAKNHSIYVIGGTFPEKDNNKFYNTCTVWNPQGEMVAKFRKMHLFDIDIPNGITFKESDILSGGDDLVTFQINGVTAGLGICYDMRFEELAKLYRLKGCKLLVYPGAFNMTTGPLHWELLQRARALDNQVYVFAISPARGEKGYIAWGHSQVTDPWGKVVAQAQHGEEIIYADVDFGECDKVRSQIPIFHQRRSDIYDTVCKING